MFEYLKPYQQFQSVEEMNEHVQFHLERDVLTAAQRKVLMTIAQHALAYPGAAHLKADTIAKKAGISSKTVFRAVKKLTELRIIRKIPMTKLNGIRGANIYCILPYVPLTMSNRRDQEKPHYIKAERALEKKQPFSFQSIFSSNIYNNIWHTHLHELFMSFPISDSLKNQLPETIAAVALTCVKEFHRAKQILFTLIKQIATGTLHIQTSLKALYIGAYYKWSYIGDSIVNSSSFQEKAERKGRPVPFYNWLDEREVQ